MTITVVGTPPSKKNSRIKNKRTGYDGPSAKYMGWIDSAVLQIRICAGTQKFDKPVRIEAVFYRDARADLDNLLASFGDALQKAGTLKNDRLIREWRARLVTDKSRPRIEAEIEAI